MVWLRQNWFKVAILGLILVFSSYYFFVMIPNERIQAKTENCRKIGEEYRKNEIKEGLGLSFYVPKYAYSRVLDTCIYSGGFIGLTNDEHNVTRYIKDLNTNEEIVSSTYIGSEKLFGVDTSEFN